MKSYPHILTLFVFLVLTAGCSDRPPSGQFPETVADADDDFGAQLGRVDFPVSCSDAARSDMKRGLSLLHHMTYEGAMASFDAALDADDSCAMASWGKAMTIIHPLWPDQPTNEALEQGAAWLDQAGSGSLSAWERAFVDAARAYFEKGTERTESERLASYAEGWKIAYTGFPDNLEAAAFYALAHMATAPKSDLTFRVQLEAGAIAEAVLAKNPDHPGAHHYIIHAYDYPSLAQRAREVSDSYGNVAPDVPHALHMPTHIFTRLGMWDESIDWNIRSARAARSHTVNGAISMHYLHALDYLAYAHLQRAEDNKAVDVMDSLNALNSPMQAHAASAYTSAAVPARLALERKRWDEAANLSPRIPETLPWDDFAQYEAITRFGRALGASFTGDLQGARTEIDLLAALRDKLEQKQDAYWSKQVAIQHTAARAWLAFHSGSSTEALDLMREAAALEATTHKNPITPGEVLPAQELYGDMLLALDRPAEALVAYQAALERSPNRYNGLYGAARAAELNGDMDAAMSYYRDFLTLTGRAESQRPEIEYARTYVRG